MATTLKGSNPKTSLTRSAGYLAATFWAVIAAMQVYWALGGGVGRAGGSTATLTSWYVDDVEGVVEELTERGVVLEHYEEGPILTDEKGIATFEGGAKVAYFRDPDGNTLSIATAPRA